MKVSLFITCLSDAIYPKVGEAMACLLSRYGVQLDFPKVQTCCGQPSYNSGYWDETRVAAKTILKAFNDSDFVVSPSGSCTYMIHHYPELFKDEPEWLDSARRLEQKTYEFTQFMVQVLGVTDVGASFPHTVTYHPSCHGTRLLGVKEEPMKMLGSVKGLQLVPLPFAEDCCGFGGTFAVKMPDISGAMVTEKVDHIRETEAEVLVGLDMACLMNIAGNLRYREEPVRVMHLAELLYEGVKHA
ncbi:(Fe-S)-binding protein [Paenibacillus sp. SEL3]|jgi:L-lactate dehydrogenase complex protein LldE|uniref:(Fe-S)-binding protein n=1 Tax=Paenibacillus polymyxa TaxID=1406 RepID=A0A8I1IZZ8_PAEPO|nr:MULTISPECIES: (Fe-S)-binding protein [Paenibacillus]KAF6566543.1 (Fe-S)-binding protein [Paenibacillus sp. EKM206P]KAF6584535.1 (Fe-S)-binding protein [Paenibacillus sp. EKM205P]MBM0636303.1 (Fe-S)-binding protein [Paenibacillus polymyxa]MBO3284580.1 (Fe-S)-binding protein [Paenibacillus polymyxa]MBP1312715.1 L-lactate dehydrogenase complex protein LldE [Paenibacillus sp. 1182]